MLTGLIVSSLVEVDIIFIVVFSSFVDAIRDPLVFVVACINVDLVVKSEILTISFLTQLTDYLLVVRS